mmetsp:Transcript_24929/g.44339  ORF Transcript_24929/g.44339 Transcript_24929/m.44339 type:complete len:204 (-) Transcript_24929:364-975(-)
MAALALTPANLVMTRQNRELMVSEAFDVSEEMVHVYGHSDAEYRMERFARSVDEDAHSRCASLHSSSSDLIASSDLIGFRVPPSPRNWMDSDSGDQIRRERYALPLTETHSASDGSLSSLGSGLLGMPHALALEHIPLHTHWSAFDTCRAMEAGAEIQVAGDAVVVGSPSTALLSEPNFLSLVQEVHGQSLPPPPLPPPSSLH